MEELSNEERIKRLENIVCKLYNKLILLNTRLQNIESFAKELPKTLNSMERLSKKINIAIEDIVKKRGEKIDYVG